MKIFVGYDTREDIAYQVCKHSILNKQPAADVRPLKQQNYVMQAGIIVLLTNLQVQNLPLHVFLYLN